MSQSHDLQHLMSQASLERPPDVDVALIVLQRIVQRPTEVASRDPLSWFAGLSLTTAAIVLMVVYSTWDTFQDPLMFLVEPIRVALP